MNTDFKTGIRLTIGAILLIAILVFALMRGRGKGEEQQGQNVIHEIQDGEVQDVPSSKSDAYMSYAGSSGIDEYWDSCEDDLKDMIVEEPVDSVLIYGPGPGHAAGAGAVTDATSQDLFGEVEPARPEAARSTATAPRRETAQEREARHQRHREEAIELADDIQRRREGRDGDGEQEDPSPLPESVPETIDVSQGGTVRRSDVVSSMDDRWEDGGVSSLDGPESAAATDGMHPFRCMFVREEKIRSGQRVSVRLLEDMVIGSVLIPKNSHLMATCNIGTRLELEIANLEMQGRIIALDCEAYDTDGTKGIYCPDAGQTAKTVGSKGSSLAGTALRSRVGRVAGDVISTGISIMENATGEKTVSVPAGYTFFIAKKRNP